jgi:hypothetical protein
METTDSAVLLQHSEKSESWSDCRFDWPFLTFWLSYFSIIGSVVCYAVSLL